MGTNFAPSELAAIGWRRIPTMHALKRINPLRKQLRRRIRAIANEQHSPIERFSSNALQINDAALEFQEKSYAYLENALSDNYYKALVSQFPKRRYFDPFYDMTKTYDWGFVWNRGKSDPQHLHKFPALRAMYDHVRSEEFCQMVTDLCGDGIQRECYTVDTTYARSGAYLTPHQDAVIEDNTGSAFVNFIFFVSGNGDPFTGGGTSFSSDAEMKHLLLVPSTLNNSIVMYRSQKDIWHGFRPLGKGQTRQAVIFQYCSTSFINS
jgi:Rps23 Pro-64 3,4-dihydroxylase Tpa1-like proline 4-hydroxylase